MLVRLADDEVVAYSRVYTHAGCLVGYDANNEVLFCPCHGAEYDPARHHRGPGRSDVDPAPVHPDPQVDPASGAVILPS